MSKEKLIVLNRQIDAVILDMDGTLIDSTNRWHDIDKAFFNKRGMEIPEDYAQKIVHLGLTQAAKLTKELYGIKESEQEIMDEWHQMSLDMYRNDVKLKPGAVELLELFKKHNVQLAIATANDDQLYMPCIERLGIGKYFSYIADVNNIKEGKHSAKIYLYLADKMSTKPENTMVIEDMPTCIKTAHDSGFFTVAVYDDASKNFDQEKRSNSDLFINSFNDLIELLK
ncbi:MAG: HAD family phosphatase [Bacilli bacterium]|nr:HAD family phosphatase [Bacilli bacterium]